MNIEKCEEETIEGIYHNFQLTEAHEHFGAGGQRGTCLSCYAKRVGEKVVFDKTYNLNDYSINQAKRLFIEEAKTSLTA